MTWMQREEQNAPLPHALGRLTIDGYSHGGCPGGQGVREARGQRFPNSMKPNLDSSSLGEKKNET